MAAASIKRAAATKVSNGGSNALIKVGNSGLDQRWQESCEALLADPKRVMVHAYIKGHPDMAEKPIEYQRQYAKRMFDKPEVQKYLKVRMREIAAATKKKYQLSQERVLKEMSSIAFYDPADIFKADGTVKSIHDIPEHARRAISQFEVLTNRDGDTCFRVKMSNKEGYLRDLAKALGVFDDPAEKGSSNPVGDLVKQISSSGGAVSMADGPTADLPPPAPGMEGAPIVYIPAGPIAGLKRFMASASSSMFHVSDLQSFALACFESGQDAKELVDGIIKLSCVVPMPSSKSMYKVDIFDLEQLKAEEIE